MSHEETDIVEIAKETLISMYRKMLEIRRFEEKVWDLFGNNLVPGTLHLYIGQEATAVGVCANLQIEDYITSTHRGHGHCIAKGANMNRIMAEILGKETAEKVRHISLMIYEFGRDRAAEKGIIVADTKFEFGRIDDRLILIDEVLTPDSSRFWPMDAYRPGGPQMSFDKQFLRDYLVEINWPKKPPPPKLPLEVINKTREKYLEALERLTGHGLD